MDIGVLFSDNGILAFNKPAGVCSQGPKTEILLSKIIREFYPTIHLVHRIDKFTSGINLAGLTTENRKYLQVNWHQITKKYYLAIIKNPVWETRTVNKKLDKKSAVTKFDVLERSGKFALIKCELAQNGRKHQIRRHLRSIGCPIVGDKKYKGLKTTARAGQLLHAWRMELKLPDSLWIRICAPIPNDFRQYPFNWSTYDSKEESVLLNRVITIN